MYLYQEIYGSFEKPIYGIRYTPWSCRAFDFSGFILVEICYYPFHITQINFLGVFPFLFQFYKVCGTTLWPLV